MDQQAGSGVDFSPLGLFMHADGVVKAVMVVLLLASVGCWAVMASKLAAYAAMRRRLRRFEAAFAARESFEELEKLARDGGLSGSAALFVAAMDEWSLSLDEQALSPQPMQARLQLVLDSALAEQAELLTARLGFLATVASASPFIGLFGTVWGIMNAFTAIAASKDTSLAVVAPGIAEALSATALGLLAAIPAVIGYNRLNGDAGRLVGRMEHFADRLAARLSRGFPAWPATAGE